MFIFFLLFLYGGPTLAVLLYLQPQVEHMDLLDFSVIAVILQAELLPLWLLGRTFRPVQLVGRWVYHLVVCRSSYISPLPEDANSQNILQIFYKHNVFFGTFKCDRITTVQYVCI